LAVGCLVFTAVDFVVWPVNREHVIAHRLVIMMRSAADLMGNLDPRVVLAPNSVPRAFLHRNLRGVLDIRGETDPAPGTEAFVREEETLRLADEVVRMLVARIGQARREVSGDASPADSAPQRETWAAMLRSQADRLERDEEVVVVGSWGAARPPLSSTQ
jgi:hypothetical protein